jgi:hypothetical protein
MSKNQSGRNSNSKETKSSSKGKTVLMTKERAKAIQSNADKFDKNQSFKSRVMSAADRNETQNE